MKTIKSTGFTIHLIWLFSVFSHADLIEIPETELSNTYGQAIFEVKEQVVKQTNGSDLSMLRLTIGAQVEINANIGKIALGRYWRPEGTNCTGGAGGNKVCFNNQAPATYNDNIKWACTSKPCGAVGLTDSFKSSGLTHSVGEKKFSEFPGGFEPDGGVDVKIRDLTMGQINCDSSGNNCQMTPFVQQNPYLEFAFDESKGFKQLVGFRLGAEDSFGYQGNIIDVVSGFIRPSITAGLGLLGELKLTTQLGGVRTIGWIERTTTTVTKIDGPAVLLTPLIKSNLQILSSTGQLFPVQSNYLNHSKAFFFSLGTRSIDWSAVSGFRAATSQPGFWANLGGDGALVSKTQEGDHPINYYPGTAKYDLYRTAADGKPAQNYTQPQPSWSETYQ